MSNRFRFRVWNDESKRYESFPWHVRAHNTQLEVEGEHLSLEQCTGNRDINGKLIYEGDVVNLHYTILNGLHDVNKEATGIIEWFEWGFALKLEFGVMLQLGNMFCYSINDVEIIGNIHENPELMEE